MFVHTKMKFNSFHSLLGHIAWSVLNLSILYVSVHYFHRVTISMFYWQPFCLTVSGWWADVVIVKITLNYLEFSILQILPSNYVPIHLNSVEHDNTFNNGLLIKRKNCGVINYFTKIIYYREYTITLNAEHPKKP